MEGNNGFFRRTEDDFLSGSGPFIFNLEHQLKNKFKNHGVYSEQHRLVLDSTDGKIFKINQQNNFESEMLEFTRRRERFLRSFSV